MKRSLILMTLMASFLSLAWNETAMDLFDALVQQNEIRVEDIVQRQPSFLNSISDQIFHEARGDHIYDSQGQTPLTFSLNYELEGMTMLLLELGADPNRKNLEGTPPLVLAGEKGNPHIISLLIQAGAQREAISHQGHSPLTQAMAQCNFQAADTLVHYGSRLSSDSPEIFPLTKEIYQKKIHLRDSMVLSDVGLESHRLLEAAALGDYQGMLQALAQGLDPNSRDSQGISPLMVASYHGNLHEVQLLLSEGAAPNGASVDGLRPLAIAAARGDLEIMEVLVTHGADVNRGDTLEETALFYALIYREKEALQWLIECGALLNRRDGEGRTALIIAAFLGDKWAMDHLLEFGASPLISDNEGQSAIFYGLKAYQKNGGVDYYTMLDRLIEEGLNPREYASLAMDPRMKELLEARWR